MNTLPKKYQPDQLIKNKSIKKVSGIKTTGIFLLDHLPETGKTLDFPREMEKKGSTESLQSVVEIPQEIQLTIREIGQGKFLNFQTDRGILNYKWPQEFPLSVKQQSGRQLLHLLCLNKEQLSNFSIAVRAIHQILVGVAKGYKEKLKLVGVGYKGFLEGPNRLKIILGYSHGNYHQLDPTVAVSFNRKNTRFHLSGISLPVVSGTAAALHSLKKPDVYKGKGVRYKGIPLVKKEGKKKK